MTIATLLFALLTVPSNAPAAGEPIMLDFTASWCGPCRQARPIVEQLVEKGYPIRPVDIDQNAELAEQYGITAVPTFVVIDPSDGREIDRVQGPQPADILANLYNQARSKIRSQAKNGRETRPESAEPGDNPTENERVEAPAQNPKPWETVVRIKVHGNGSIGFGSGTVIHSTPEESLILTCAHIFKMENGRTPPPGQFTRKITIDLFDGKLRGMKPAQVHYTGETFAGQAVDYDFSRDVGLIRIRPGRRLPYAKVVPPHWKPKANFAMITVGCSEGHDATAWDTVVVNPTMKGLNGNRAYEAIECMIAPKQGRSGGGLFTSDGYVAGVCDFAEPQGNHGLYASPASIYKILDRNDLMALYSPTRTKPQTILAKNRPVSGRGEKEFRMQSPDRNEPGGMSLPPPEMLGIKPPVVAENDASISGTQPSGRRNRDTWHPTPSSPSPARAVDLKLDPESDPDRFGVDERESNQAQRHPGTPPALPKVSTGKSWKAGKAPLPGLAGAF